MTGLAELPLEFSAVAQLVRRRPANSCRMYGIGVIFGDGSPTDPGLSIGCGDPRLSLVCAS
jgi:hypothetical protein